MAVVTETMLHEASVAMESLEQAARRCANAHNRVAELEDERALIKAQCIKAMIGTPNPLSDGKAHSASSAEKIVEEHPRYQAHRQEQRDAEVERWMSLGNWEAAKLRARLAGAIIDS